MNLKKELVMDLLMCGIFIISGWYVRNVFCIVIYASAYALFVLLHRNQIKALIGLLRSK